MPHRVVFPHARALVFTRYIANSLKSSQWPEHHDDDFPFVNICHVRRLPLASCVLLRIRVGLSVALNIGIPRQSSSKAVLLCCTCSEAHAPTVSTYILLGRSPYQAISPGNRSAHKPEHQIAVMKNESRPQIVAALQFLEHCRLDCAYRNLSFVGFSRPLMHSV